MAFYTAQHHSQTTSYGHCDSFFVESSDPSDAWFESRQRDREQARQLAKQRQHALAGELSRLTSEDYQDDILDHMELMEVRTLADVNSIDIQTEIQWFMRPYLLDFLVEAHSAFNLLPDTLYLAVNILDRYCSRRVVYKRHYQLVGCAALLIAAKYGDRKDRVPQIKELKAMCCSLYEENMFTQMEWHLLQTLDWHIGHPTVDSFLQLAMSEGAYDAGVEHLSWYITELALFHKDFVSVLPSVMARSALHLARHILGRPSPGAASPSPAWADRYDAELVARLYLTLQQPSTVVAKKYATYQLSSVSLTAQMFVDRQLQLEKERQRRSLFLAAAAASVPVAEVGGVWSAPAAAAPAACGVPHTPQKLPYSSAVNHGMYTPPITPENDRMMYAAQQQGQQQGGGAGGQLPPMMPMTPTPPSSVEHGTVKQYGHTYELPQDQRYWAS